MTEKKEEIDRARKEKLKPKQFVKNPIPGTKFTLYPSLKFILQITSLSILLRACPI